MSEENTSTGSAAVEPIPPDGPIGGVPLAKPIHIQRLEQAVRLNQFLDFVDKYMEQPLLEESKEDTNQEFEEIGREFVPKSQLEPSAEQESVAADANPDHDLVDGGTVAKAERRADKRKFFNFGKIKKNRRWLKAILLSDSSDPEDDEEEEDKPLSKDDLREMLRLHKYRRQCKNQFYIESELQQYQYYSAGLLSNYDKFLDHQRTILGPKKTKKTSSSGGSSSKLKEKLKREKERKILRDEQVEQQMMQESVSDYDGSVAVFQDANRKFTSIKDIDVRRKRIWLAIAKRDIPKAHKHRASVHNNILTNCRKLAQACQKELRRTAIQSQRQCKETPYRARRLTREMMAFWKHYEKVEKEHRRKAEKEAQEQRRIDDEFREAKRQQRKLNFLITQTELYAHFMSRKLTGRGDEERDRILNLLDEKMPQRQRTVKEGVLVDIEADDYDSETMKQRALMNVTTAYNSFESSKEAFDSDLPVRSIEKDPGSFSLSTPSMETEHPQPSLFRGTLKCYQLKGMNWLANLYDCGINGILADEMGLGKTVQSIAFLAHLAENQDIWGPFLVVAPASTLHNWTQECARFLPKLRVLPYWGNPQDRKTLRKFWGQRTPTLHTEQAEFHILVTSYQLVVQDIRYFQRIKWHYMILDEAQAIKSSSSIRWRLLLGFNCRNRLLLTGTPIQNSMAELWALLHFIMPTLFDSHEEFNEWFSKDIESHVEKQSGINEEQLSRLHMILKPFMLRRVKKDVENELSDKIEILMYCQLSTRQRLFYQAIKNKISIEDLLKSHSSATAQTQGNTNNLMNLVMQFRKVCNHPELFEKRETKSPYHIQLDEVILPKVLLTENIVDCNPGRDKVLYNTLSIFAPDNIHRSLFPPPCESPCTSRSAFSFTRFVDVSPGQLQALVGRESLVVQWLRLFLVMKAAYRVYQDQQWKETDSFKRRLLLVSPLHPTSHPSQQSGTILRDLVFTSWTTALASHCTHVYHHMAETGWHKRVRTRNAFHHQMPSVPTTPQSSLLSSPQVSSSPSYGMVSPLRHKSPASASPTGAKSPGYGFGTPGKSPSSQESESPAAKQGGSLLLPGMRPVIVRRCQRTEMPSFLFCTIHKVSAAPVKFHCNDRQASYRLHRLWRGDSPVALQCAKYGSAEIQQQRQSNLLRPPPPGGLAAVKPQCGWSKIWIPDREHLVTDSGKMHVLDELLSRLKDQGHRVLIYSQMTRMIDILEEFMWHRKHTYMRLDGSSKISDRRDMVAGFQTRSDIFVFLLSTRAGGLGINLTAADTVIFYDSDWNPTVDQQAMDRAHRLGQTKQVTVYRLICKGTIEEHILERAREKSEIQRMVITGGNFKLDQLKPKEVVSLLLDDEDIERKFRQKQSERKSWDDKPRSVKERKRKRDKEGEAMKEVGKKVKGELQFDSTNVSLDGDDSIISVDSSAPSPVSVVSVGSESNQPRSLTMTPVPQDENSNDGLLIVDEASPSQPTEGDDHSPAGKQRLGRGHWTKQGSGGVKKTSQRAGRPRKGIAAAAMAGARAGAVAGTAAAYAAYGFNLVGKQESSGTASNSLSSATPSNSSVSQNDSIKTALSPEHKPSTTAQTPTTASQVPSTSHTPPKSTQTLPSATSTLQDTSPPSVAASSVKGSPQLDSERQNQVHAFGVESTKGTLSNEGSKNYGMKNTSHVGLQNDTPMRLRKSPERKANEALTVAGNQKSPKASHVTQIKLEASLKGIPGSTVTNHGVVRKKSSVRASAAPVIPTNQSRGSLKKESPNPDVVDHMHTVGHSIHMSGSVPASPMTSRLQVTPLLDRPSALATSTDNNKSDELQAVAKQSPRKILLHMQSQGPGKDPPLSKSPVAVHSKSPTPSPLKLGLASGTKSPVRVSPSSTRAKSPISSTAPSKSPFRASPVTKSPGRKSPGRQSPGQVAPLDLRSKPTAAVSESSPTTTQGSS
ncbi:chromatin-remodeling ATPase INO80-like [Diadema setosum]|uniref:chromatin-remodeling ATPase INO80-like n=1 Tax=Diadema setosum TaxID=31175 RepID=UPI003B3A2029